MALALSNLKIVNPLHIKHISKYLQPSNQTETNSTFYDLRNLIKKTIPFRPKKILH